MREVADSLLATVRTPAVDILVFGFVVPSTFQVTDLDGSPTPSTVAVNVWVVPWVTDAVEGDTVTPVTEGGRPSKSAFTKLNV